MFSIMVFHQMWFYGHVIDNFFYYYGSWGVDFFLFVSGFGIAHSLQKNKVLTFYNNRIKRIVPYCLVFGIVRAFFYYNGIHGFVPNWYPHIGLVACSLDLWYIEAIIFYYLMSPVLNRGLQKWGGYFLVVIILVSFLYSWLPKPDFFTHWHLLKRFAWAVSRLPVFSFGLYMFQYIDNYPKRLLKYTGLFLISLAMIQVKAPDWIGLKAYISCFVCFSVPGICMAIADSRPVIERLKLVPLLYWLGKNSLLIYLCHEFVYWSIFNHLTMLPGLVSFPLAITIVYILVTITNKVVNNLLYRFR